MKKYDIILFDLDGTLTQHKSPLEESARKTLDALSEKYKLLMVGAGRCERIFAQMGGYPIDIIGNYGMEYAEYNAASGNAIKIVTLAPEVEGATGYIDTNFEGKAQCAIKELESKGYVSLTHRRRANGSKQSNLYTCIK